MYGWGESSVSHSFRCLTVVYGYHFRVVFFSREIVWLTIMTDQRAIFNISVTPIMQYLADILCKTPRHKELWQ